MANFGLGLAQGFEIGTRMQEAYRKRRMREEFEAAQADKQRPKYTPAQGEQMRREAAMVDEFGNPLYEFSIEPGSTQYTRREVRYPNARAEELPQMSLADAESEALAPRSLGTMYRTPTGTMGLRGENFTPDTTGQTEYDVDDKGFRQLSFAEAQRVYADPRHDPNLSANAQYDKLFGPQSRKELSVSGPEYSSALLPPEQSRVQQRLGREYGDSMMYSPEATQYLDQTYGAEGLTPTQQRAALMNRYADIISKYDSPVEGERFRSLARAEERAEQTFDLNTQLSKLQIAQVARTDKEASELDQLSKEAMDYRRANPSATPRDIVNHLMFAVKASPAALNKYVAQVAQVDAAELQLMNSNIDRKIRGKSLTGMIALYNDDPMFDPNTNMVEEKGPKGEVVLKVVDSKDPSKVLETFSFKDPTTARDFLINSAKNPGQQAQWLRTMQLQEDQGVYFRARAERYAAGGVGRRQGRDYTRAENIQEIRALMQFRDSLARDADRKRDQLNNMRKDDPMYKALQKDIINIENDIFDIDRDIRDARKGGGGLRRDGGGAAPERYESGKVYPFSDEKGNVKDYRLKEGKTGAAPEDWEEVKGAPAPKAEAEAKAAPAKEEPPKKDTTKYIREKSPRSGTFIYTESPRGLTKEQWAQLDEDKKKK